MADSIKLATGQPIDLSNPMTTLGGQLGQALGGGLQQLAANRIQRLQQQQQVGGLAQLLGGNQELAQNILSQSPDIQKQLLGGLFKPEQALTPYQQSQQELAQKTLEQKEKIAGFKEQRELRKEQEIIYDKNIAPLLKERDNARSANRRLASLSDKAKQITTTDRLIEGLPEGTIKDYATLLQSSAAIGAKKDQAAFIRGVNDVIKGKLTNYEAKIWLDQFPNILTTSVTASRDVINSLIWLNNLAIRKADIADKIYQENPSIRRDELERQIDKEVKNLLDNDPSFKKKSSLDVQAAEPKTLQPEQPQEQPQLTPEQPQEQLQTAPTPQEQAQAIATPQEQAQPQQFNEIQENQIAGYQRLFGVGREEAIRRLQQEGNKQFFGLTPQEQELKTAETLAKPVLPAFKTGVQTLAPFLTSFGDEISNILKNLGDNKIGQAAKIAEKIIPTTEKAKDLLRAAGIPEEEIENPSLLVKTLQAAGIALPLGLAAKAGKLLPLLATLATNLIGTKAIETGAGALGEAVAGEQGREVGESTARLFGPSLTQKGTKAIEKQIRKNKEIDKALNKVIKEARDAQQLAERTEKANKTELTKAKANITNNDEILANQYKELQPLAADQKAILLEPDYRRLLTKELKDLSNNEVVPQAKGRLDKLLKKYKVKKKNNNIVSVSDLYNDAKTLYKEMKSDYGTDRLNDARELFKQGIEQFGSEDFTSNLKPINEAFRQNKIAKKGIERLTDNLNLDNALKNEATVTKLFQEALRIDKQFPKAINELSQTDLALAIASKKGFTIKKGLEFIKNFKTSERNKEAISLLEKEAPDIFEEVKKSMVDFMNKPSKKTSLAFQAANSKANEFLFGKSKKEQTTTQEEDKIEPILF
jgi:hypothetical protein